MCVQSMQNKIMQSVFPVALEDGTGNAQSQTGTAFILNFDEHKFILTAAHCIISVAKYKYKLLSDSDVTPEIMKDIIEQHIFFGIIKTTNQIMRIPITNYTIPTEYLEGTKYPLSRADIIVCCVNEEELERIKNTETCSFCDLKPLELSSENLIVGCKYYIYGYPQRLFKNKKEKIKSVLSSRYLELTKIEKEHKNADGELILESGCLDFGTNPDDSFKTLEGFSGGPVLNKGKVTGLMYAIPHNKSIIKFITSREIKFILEKYIKKLHKSIEPHTN